MHLNKICLAERPNSLPWRSRQHRVATGAIREPPSWGKLFNSPRLRPVLKLRISMANRNRMGRWAERGLMREKQLAKQTRCLSGFRGNGILEGHTSTSDCGPSMTTLCQPLC